MDESPTNMLATGDDEKLRLAAPQLLPCEMGTRARTAEAHARGKLVARGFQLKEKARRPKVDPIVHEPARSSEWRPVVVMLVILLAVGGGLWRWRTTATKPKARVIESPLEFHKRQFLAALRGGSNAPPMHLRADRMRFHQQVLLSRGFLEERKFEFTNGAAAKVRLPVSVIDGVETEYAMVEPRGSNVLVLVAPRDDIPAWESLMRLAGAK